ncbi:hypothetical protein QBC42DRAFT_318114 [Cladorrhinum samala]|uniref:Uncharacterized protein n=1 Tax=Cladorrhinum samala TaxID=585594 RepID=A0AAV9HWA4_9PEZI|nr:hypothetical protein QBC42DRAFT_318114 [Cladorrhinum samala]
MWSRSKSDRGQPLKAMVKELVAGENGQDCLGFKPEHVPQMWEDLKSLHTLGIPVGDINFRNYLDGKLVDFGQAWTMFHPCFDQMPPKRLREERRAGMMDLNKLCVD